jgi:hypothetical protein
MLAVGLQPTIVKELLLGIQNGLRIDFCRFHLHDLPLLKYCCVFCKEGNTQQTRQRSSVGFETV